MDTNVLRHYTSITYVLAHIWLMIEASECKSLPRVAGCESRDCNSTCIGALWVVSLNTTQVARVQPSAPWR
jgi:hypothetical protein